MNDEPPPPPTGRSGWVNGVALLLLLPACLFLVVTHVRYGPGEPDVRRVLAILATYVYALGLVVGVILIRPRPRYQGLFGWVFLPFFVQFALYGVGWFEAAGFDSGLHPMGAMGLIVIAFFGGWPFLGPLIPCTRRWHVFAFTQTVLTVVLALLAAADW